MYVLWHIIHINARIFHIPTICSHYAVNACLTPVCAVHGHAVTTVEGIGDYTSNVSKDGSKQRRRLHAVQERLAKAHGSQCGFCTPGFVMSMYTLLRNDPLPSMHQVEEGFQGNMIFQKRMVCLSGYKNFEGLVFFFNLSLSFR